MSGPSIFKLLREIQFGPLFFLFTIFYVQNGIAQEDYKGRVLDAKTGEPVPYVNIGIFGKGIGTVSDEEGLFHLQIDKTQLDPEDIVQFSSMGYQILKKTVANLEFADNEYPEVTVQSENIKLNEVIVTGKGAQVVSDMVGYQNYGEKNFGYWKDNIALGGELATKVKVKKGFRRLNTLFFEVFSSHSDSVLLRVNLYKTGKSKRTTGENLNGSKKNILHIVYPNTEMAIVDLKPYSIYVRDDFIVSLELLKVYGDKPIGLVLAASGNQTTYSLRKSASLDQWEVLPKISMAYHLNTSYFSNNKKINSKAVKVQKSKKKISGFVFSARQPLTNVKITNLISNEEVYSNEKGRYQVSGEKNDILRFEKIGFKKILVKLLDKSNVNITLTR